MFTYTYYIVYDLKHLSIKNYDSRVTVTDVYVPRGKP